MQEPLRHAALKEKQRSLREDFPETMGLRVHRALSWIGRADEADDADGRFIFLWIAFNAAYADESEFQTIAPPAREAFADFFRKVNSLDPGQRIYNAIWENFSGPIRVLMENRFVFYAFWQHYNGMTGYDDWSTRFHNSNRQFINAFKKRDTVRVLGNVFDRLYVLRNQLLHGGSTWNSDINRDQVRDGAAILEFLVPVFVDVMMDNPREDWGRPFYPVVP